MVCTSAETAPFSARLTWDSGETTEVVKHKKEKKEKKKTKVDVTDGETKAGDEMAVDLPGA